MDNNQTQPGQNQAQLGQNPTPIGQNTTPVQTPVPQQVPTETAQSITQQPVSPMPQNIVPPKKNHIVKILLIIVVLATIIALSVLVYQTFINNQSGDSSSIQIDNKTTTRTPSPAKVLTEEEELNAIDAGNVDNDLEEVETDLQSL